MSDWFERVPKVELHLHVQGAVPLDALWELISKYGDESVPNRAALVGRFRYSDFPHFIRTWVWVRGFMREYDDIEHTTEAFARSLVEQNIRYAEAFFSPSDYHTNALETGRVAEAYRRGLARVPEARVNLIADLVRDFGPEKARRTLAEVNEVRGLGIVGIGIGGSEQRFPPEPFAAVYEEARRLGFRTSAHAGEAAGAESVWGAVRDLRVDRIGHATRAVEDPALVDRLVELQIPLELCPVSNVRTGVVASLEDHPVRHYVERGLPVSINTDDPTLFQTRLADEYRALQERLGFTREQIQSLILAAIDASWLDEREKSELSAGFRGDSSWSRGSE